MSERRLRRFFTRSPLQTPGEVVLLDRENTRHLKEIIRAQIGDHCLLTNGQGREAKAIILAYQNDQARLEIKQVSQSTSFVTGIQLFVYAALIQKGKMDDLVRQLQELGVAAFFPTETERTIVKMTAEAKKKVVSRWDKLIQEAAKQSGSLKGLQLSEPQPLKQILERIPNHETRAVFHPGKEALLFRDWALNLEENKPVHLFFGPEGGFSEKEMQIFEAKKISKISLGATLLKADTAVLGVTSALRFLYL